MAVPNAIVYAPKAPSAALKRALVVEDIEHIRHMETHVLRRAGFEVTTLPNGLYAAQYLINDDVDVAIIDIMMPERNGYEIITEVREQAPRRLSDIIAATATPQTTAEALGVPIKDLCAYLIKPFDIDKLVMYANRCADRRLAASR
jgi:DNA-binding response OmpR family regulator